MLLFKDIGPQTQVRILRVPSVLCLSFRDWKISTYKRDEFKKIDCNSPKRSDTAYYRVLVFAVYQKKIQFETIET